MPYYPCSVCIPLSVLKLLSISSVVGKACCDVACLYLLVKSHSDYIVSSGYRLIPVLVFRSEDVQSGAVPGSIFYKPLLHWMSADIIQISPLRIMTEYHSTS
ncbi:hypothetical protein EJ05DRAFT_155204 [Pseudovirgaria hyperparasitica]|uniref:Uncharacterized protein n=1 Tax=Pseudovirgaria hyperparasitica TaxID=470096 RepID=A0A6A6VUC2_9PEZI|nr:uncharacterized protein EJ05DRAFT_155204 [Pseudovirgaria hyperparasitica]KAF2754288.1 hypothetical protein EJ05DRAFT_155204 [Pseudovirgaria hyperparasitica]